VKRPGTPQKEHWEKQPIQGVRKTGRMNRQERRRHEIYAQAGTASEQDVKRRSRELTAGAARSQATQERAL